MLLALAAAVGVWLYDLGSSFAGFNKEGVQKEIASLRAENKVLTEEREKFNKASINAESRLAIELATQKKIIEQSKTLEADNAKLKEDLGFFESLLPATGAADAITMRNVRAQLDAVNQRVVVKMLVMQAGKNVNDFIGTVQVSATGIANGKAFNLNYPAAGAAPTAEGKLSFNRYQRVELAIPLDAALGSAPKGIVLKSVVAKVLQGGTVKAQSPGLITSAVVNLDAAQ